MLTRSPALRSDSRRPRIAAFLWLCCLIAVGVHQWRFWHEARLDANVLALLPQMEQDGMLHAANARLAGLGERRVVVLVGAADAAMARRAADAARTELLRDAGVLRVVVDTPADATVLVQALTPWRDRLLTTAQRRELAGMDVDLAAQRALAALYQPFGTARLTPFAVDPLTLWPDWWRERASASRARPQDGLLMLEGEGKHWVLLNFDAAGSAFSVTGDLPVSVKVATARVAAQAVSAGAVLLAAGVPLHAEAAAAQASSEVNTIGWGSLIAVLVLVWLTFRSLQPIALVALSLVAGCAVGLSVTALVFGQVHLLTLVFGASLVGVAEDYGFHWFAARQSAPDQAPRDVLRHLLPGLALALATSVVAYLALGLAPFPGLRQMAVFSASGLAAAFLSVIFLFPWMDRRAPKQTRFAARCTASLAHWPRWKADRRGGVVALIAFVFVVAGMARLQTRDDLRQLHAAPPDLVVMQARIGALLGMPSPAQFYLVEGEDTEAVLAREEALRARLDVSVTSNVITGYQALSQWLPSAARQRDDASLSAQLETSVIARLNAETGDDLVRPPFATRPLTLADVGRMPDSSLLLRTWLGHVDGRAGSIVMLTGVQTSSLPALAADAQGIEGVRFVDRSADLSALLARYRVGMAILLGAGYVGVLLLLLWRYRSAAWRALTPTLIGSLVTLAAFGWMGWPLQLFGVLGLLLLLGMGVDYGIFLLEHPGDGSAWLAVALAGISTLLAFGLLALSATPSLRAFGLTMLIGEVSIWLITPCFRPPALTRI